MLNIPQDISQSFGTLLNNKKIDGQYHVHYNKWLRYYLDFCHKNGFDSADKQSFPAFKDKLKSKKQSWESYGNFPQSSFFAGI
ncbi:MAG: hypothetical protein HQK66_13125 [Desulfamplus sp.]|nr:hypothetical protein [Desulfamplus sp.]